MKRQEMILSVILLFFIFVGSHLTAFVMQKKNFLERSFMESEAKSMVLSIFLRDLISKSHETLMSDKVPAILWGLTQWPLEGQIAVGTRDKKAFLFQGGSGHMVSSTPIEIDEINRMFGSEVNGTTWEWITQLTSNAAHSPVGARITSETLTSRTAESSSVLPNSTTLILAKFKEDLITTQSPFFLELQSSMLITLTSAVALFVGMQFGRRKNKPVAEGKVHDNPVQLKQMDSLSGFKDFSFFIERLCICMENSLIEKQCVIAIMIDRIGSLNLSTQQLLIKELATLIREKCSHGPLPTRFDPVKYTQKNSLISENLSDSFFLIHCPNYSTKQAVQFALTLQKEARFHGLFSSQTPKVTLSMAVVQHEFSEWDAYGKDYPRMADALLSKALEFLREAADVGGDTVHSVMQTENQNTKPLDSWE